MRSLRVCSRIRATVNDRHVICALSTRPTDFHNTKAGPSIIYSDSKTFVYGVLNRYYLGVVNSSQSPAHRDVQWAAFAR